MPTGSDASTKHHRPLALTSAPEASYDLKVIGGADVGKVLRLDGSQPGRVLVGTSPACNLVLTDETVSRRHVALEVSGARLRVTDLESTNGTFLGGLEVNDAWLSGSGKLTLGATTLEISRAAKAEISISFDESFGRVVGVSREMRRLYPLCKKVAMAQVPVLIEGETGTGKEVLAEAIHDESPRADKPFVVFDCTAVPPNLVESELFGHERGAFTGAVAQRKGVFEQADGGTLLIDEIGDLELSLQPKLLRALERGEVRRVGGDGYIKVNVRVLSATRRDLDKEVQAGRFRDDLYHRLVVARVELPPLRARKGDVAVLAERFAQELGHKDPLPESALTRWEAYAWPGNVRELRNAVARYVALGEYESLEPPLVASSSDLVGSVLSQNLPLIRARDIVVREFERRYIEHVLTQHGGSVVKAAKASGIARRYFFLIKARSQKAREE